MKTLKQYNVILGIIIVALLATCNPKEKEEESPYSELKLTDSLVTEAIEDEFQHYPEVPSHLIDVKTIDGIVELNGTINNILAKEKAEEIASAIKGVEGVIDHLKVICPYVPDNELRNQIKEMFYYDPVVNSYEITVKADSGHVILSGVVNSWNEMELAEDIAQSVSGVKSIENRIKVVYRKERPDDEILADILGILQFDIHVDHKLIHVNVKNGKVTLSGSVGSLFEKSEAISDAWVIGVDTVKAEDLKVTGWIRDPLMREEKYVKEPDKEIESAIEKVFLYDARINNMLTLNAKVTNGYVTLYGTVDNSRAKNAAEEDAKNIVGVWDVENRLKVRPAKMPLNKTIVDKTKVVLNLHPYLKPYDIKVNEENGKVSLTGRVNNYFEKEEAEELISKIPGVIKIENNIQVSSFSDYTNRYKNSNPPALVITNPDLISDSKIKEKIEKELWWSPFVNETDVIVKVKNGVATLNGEVDTPLEREYAEKNAYKGGAISVENNLIVRYGP